MVPSGISQDVCPRISGLTTSNIDPRYHAMIKRLRIVAMEPLKLVKSAERSREVTNPYKLPVDPPPSLVNNRWVASEVNHATPHGCRQHTFQLSPSREHIEIGSATHEGAIHEQRIHNQRHGLVSRRCFKLVDSQAESSKPAPYDLDIVRVRRDELVPVPGENRVGDRLDKLSCVSDYVHRRPLIAVAWNSFLEIQHLPTPIVDLKKLPFNHLAYTRSEVQRASFSTAGLVIEAEFHIWNPRGPEATAKRERRALCLAPSLEIGRVQI